MLDGVHDNCDVCNTEPDKCEELKGCVLDLMNQGVSQFARARVVEDVYVIKPIEIVYRKKKIEGPMKKIQPINICVLSPYPYQDSKAMPWKYDATTSVGGKVIQFSNAEIVNIAGTYGMTRSGHVFSSKYTPKVIPAPMVVPTPHPQTGASIVVLNVPIEISKGTSSSTTEASTSKGKEVAKEQKKLTTQEGQEFLKLIKSDFKIVEQLGQTPSKISILSLLLSSEAHYKALIKVLTAAHVIQDITVDQFDDVVANITASRYLRFNEAELPAKGYNHNKVLHISVTCVDTLVFRVLVDTGSSLKVLPKSTLSQL